MKAKPDLRKTRLGQGRYLEDVAQDSATGVSHLSYVERGLRGVSAPTARRIADALGVPMETLFVIDELAA